MAEKRSIRDFTTEFDPWPVMVAWAKKSGYRPVERQEDQEEGRHIFQKGSGFWVAPRMIEMHCQGNQVHLEAWIRAGFFVRLMSLFILPAEITIESGGIKAALPRKMARGDVNQLLELLGRPLLN